MEISGLKVTKHFHAQISLSTKFVWLINVKMPLIVDILTFMSRQNSIIG